MSPLSRTDFEEEFYLVEENFHHITQIIFYKCNALEFRNDKETSSFVEINICSIESIKFHNSLIQDAVNFPWSASFRLQCRQCEKWNVDDRGHDSKDVSRQKYLNQEWQATSRKV